MSRLLQRPSLDLQHLKMAENPNLNVGKKHHHKNQLIAWKQARLFCHIQQSRMSQYITFHDGSGIEVSPDSLWLNIFFEFQDNFLMRTDGAVMARVIEHILEGDFLFTYEPCEKEQSWCISLPVSGKHIYKEDAIEEARQLAVEYKNQIRLGNATVNRALLFKKKPYHVGKNCCKNVICDRTLHPDRYVLPVVEWNPAKECGTAMGCSCC